MMFIIILLLCTLTVTVVLLLLLLNNNINNGELFFFSTTTTTTNTNIDTCSCIIIDTRYSRTNIINNSATTNKCCERVIFRTHKFGTILLGDLFEEFRTSVHKNNNNNNNLLIETRPTPKSINYTLPTNIIDYRHVMVTRNWFDAIISGYLYHRNGYECYKEFRGDVKHHSKYFNIEQHYHNKYWDSKEYLTYHYNNNISFPLRNNRSLCTYLEEESEQDGLLVIIDIALSRWYKGVVHYWQLVQQQQKQNYNNNKNQTDNNAQQHSKTLFLCYEDLINPFQQEKIFYNIIQFLFPGYNKDILHNKIKIPLKMKYLIQQQQQTHTIYNGGHSTSDTADIQLKTRLRTMVEQYDTKFFNNTITTSNSIFKCG